MRLALVYVAIGAFALLAVHEALAGDYRIAVATLMLSVANFLLLT